MSGLLLFSSCIGSTYFPVNDNLIQNFQAESVPHLKLEVWPGYVTRIDEKEGGLMLTCDVSHRILRTETAYDVILELKRSRDQTMSFVSRINKALLGQVVLTK